MAGDLKLVSRRPAGHTIVTDDTGVISESDMLQCVHCGYQWQIRPGSGKLRGFCFRCNGPVCGQRCENCVPIEAQLEIMEGTRNPTAVSVAVPKLILPPGV
jgi:hypothetical protein